MKLNELSKTKKIGIGVAVACVVALSGWGIGHMVHGSSSTTNTTTLTAKQFEDLAGGKVKYEIKDFDSNKDKASFILVGDINEEQTKDLAKDIAKKAKSSGWSQKDINFDVVSNDADIKDAKEAKEAFYFDGLAEKVDVNLEKNVASIGTFKGIPANIKNGDINDVGEAKVGTINGTVNVDVDLKIDKDKDQDKLEDVVGQSKAYIDMFRRLNKDKDLKNVQMNINKNEEQSYSYNSSNDKVIETISNVNL